jgi:hypothetical protein
MERGIQNDADIVIHRGNHHPIYVVDHVHVLFLQLGRDMFRDHLLDLGLGRWMAKKGILGGDISLGVLVSHLIGYLRLVRMMGNWMGTCRVVLYIFRACNIVIT